MDGRQLATNFNATNTQFVAALHRDTNRSSLTAAAPALRRFMDHLGATRMRAIPYPLVIDQSQYEQMLNAGRLLIDAQTAILREWVRSMSHKEVLGMFGLPPNLAPLINWSQLETSDQVFARIDVLPTASGYKFCEFNVDSSISGFEFFDCYRMLGADLGWDLFAGSQAPRDQIAQVVAETMRQGDFERVVVCDWSSRIDVGYFGFDLLVDSLKQALPDVSVELVYHADYPTRWLNPRHGRRTLVYRGFMYEDVDDIEFVDRMVSSGSTIINLFEAEIRSHKRWYSIFWDDTYTATLSEPARNAIVQYLPRTTDVTTQNFALLLRDKSDYVFKLGQSSGGYDVLIGADHEADELVKRMNERGAQGWIAQQRIDTVKCQFAGDTRMQAEDHHVVLGLYILGNGGSGMNVRADRECPIVNIHQTACSGWAVPMNSGARQRFLDRLLST